MCTVNMTSYLISSLEYLDPDVRDVLLQEYKSAIPPPIMPTFSGKSRPVTVSTNCTSGLGNADTASMLTGRV